MPRNVHKSAINGVILSGALPVFPHPEVDPEYGITNGITYTAVKEAIKTNPGVKGIFLNNPTYYGTVSDLKAIVRLAHRHGIPVLVDEAHGSHLPSIRIYRTPRCTLARICPRSASTKPEAP